MQNKNYYNPLSYHNKLRKIKKLRNLKKINISFLSNFTSELLDAFIKVELSDRGYLPKIYFNPYDQIEQIILEKQSKIYKNKQDVIILALRLESLLSDNFDELIYDQKKLSNKILEIEKRFFLLLKTLRLNNNYSKILIFNVNFIEHDIQGFTSTSVKTNLDFVIEKINSYLIDISRKFNDVFIFDLKKVSQNIGLKNFFDKKLFLLSRMPFTSIGQIEISKQLSRFINAILVPPKKCLVVDADNVLWGGVIGEDKLDGIKLGEDFPGNIYKSFHRYLLSLRKKGILLTLASKNNKKDVLEVFSKHQDCILKKKHFSILEINWNDKASNIKEIANKLNIGLNSIVFFDDNPAERELVKQKLPAVNVIEVDANPLTFEESINNSEFFDHVILTEDDRKRANMYEAENKRKKIAKKILNIDDYLISLKTKIKIGRINNSTIKRCTQLINKTNQFNLTLKRKSEMQIKNLISKDAIGLWIRVSDKFGDNGLVGIILAILDDKRKQCRIETFLLSCRVIGRGIEDIFLSEIIREVKKQKKYKKIIGEYYKGEKNEIVKDFYKKQGFKKQTKNIWSKDISNFKSSKYIKFVKIIRKN